MSLGRRAIINRLRRVGEELGRRPTLDEVLDLSDVRRSDLIREFKSFSEALQIAGLMMTREMVEKARKKRGYIPPWNALPGGETPIPNELRKAWRILSAKVISETGICEVAGTKWHPEGGCSDRLVANHIIPRRCGGPIIHMGNVDVMCDRAHKVYPPDLYWRSSDDFNVEQLYDYQLIRLIRSGLVEVSLEHKEGNVFQATEQVLVEALAEESFISGG